MPVDGVIKCRSCGWERRVAAPEPEAVDDLPGLFTTLQEEAATDPDPDPKKEPEG